MGEEMKVLVSRFAEYLRRSEQQLRCFHTYESQVEGWFKGELFCFLDREKRTGRLHDFGREQSGDDESRERTDIVLQFDESSPISWVELKHWIGRKNGRNWRHSWYFTVQRERTDSLAYCVEKLIRIREEGDKYMLVLFTPKPTSEKWNSGVQEFNNRFHPLSVRSLTNPDEYPGYFFLGLLQVSEGDRH